MTYIKIVNIKYKFLISKSLGVSENDTNWGEISILINFEFLSMLLSDVAVLDVWPGTPDLLQLLDVLHYLFRYKYPCIIFPFCKVYRAVVCRGNDD